MIRTRTVLLLVTFLLTGVLAPAADAGWLHQANSVFQATKAKERQPAKVEQVIVNAYDTGNYSICLFVTHEAKQKNKGRVVTKVRIEDEDGNLVRRWSLTAVMRDGVGMKCKDGEDLPAPVLVCLVHKLKKMPHLRTVNGSPQGVTITGVLSTDGQPAIGDGPLALEPTAGEAPRGYGPGSEGGWFHSANSIYHARKNETDYPTVMYQGIGITRETESKPLVCAGYNSAPGVPGNKGVVDTTVTIRYPKGKEETLQLSGEVQNHVLTNCQKASKRFKDGTIVVFEHHLSRMPELDKGDYADLVGAVSTTGEPDFREEEEEEEEQQEEQEEEDTDPPAPGRVFSTADEPAITRVLGQARNQLKRRKNNQPGYWVITTSKTIPDNFKTQGFGDTPAAALANYEKKMGSLGGQSLARVDRDLFAVDVVSGPLSTAPGQISRGRRSTWNSPSTEPIRSSEPFS